MQRMYMNRAITLLDENEKGMISKLAERCGFLELMETRTCKAGDFKMIAKQSNFSNTKEIHLMVFLETDHSYEYVDDAYMSTAMDKSNYFQFLNNAVINYKREQEFFDDALKIYKENARNLFPGEELSYAFGGQLTITTQNEGDINRVGQSKFIISITSNYLKDESKEVMEKDLDKTITEFYESHKQQIDLATKAQHILRQSMNLSDRGSAQFIYDSEFFVVTRNEKVPDSFNLSCGFSKEGFEKARQKCLQQKTFENTYSALNPMQLSNHLYEYLQKRAKAIEEQKAKEAAEKAEADRKAAEEAAIRKAAEEAARKKAEEEAARKRAEEEAARKKAEEEAAKKKAEEEAARKKAEEEAAKKKAAEEAAKEAAKEAEAAKKVAEEAARKAEAAIKAAEEAAKKKADEEAAQRKAAEEAARKKAAEEAAEEAAKEAEAAKKVAEEAARKAEAAKKAAEEAAKKVESEKVSPEPKTSENVQNADSEKNELKKSPENQTAEGDQKDNNKSDSEKKEDDKKTEEAKKAEEVAKNNAKSAEDFRKTFRRDNIRFGGYKKPAPPADSSTQSDNK